MLDSRLRAETGGPRLDAAGSPRHHVGVRRAWAMTCVLAGLSVFSFLDRQVLALLVPDLKASLGISDVQFGVLSGPAFVVVYNVILLAAALVVDRWNRVRLIVIGASLWTVMTILSGFAQSFDQLLVLRGGLALGEALLGPAAISLIGDLFLRSERPLPTATYVAGSVIGTTGSAMLSAFVLQVSGWLSPRLAGIVPVVPWRLTLIGVGLPGLVLAISLMVIGREPGRFTAETSADERAGFIHVRRHWPLYATIFLGFGAVNMMATALAIWGPSHLIRHFGLSQIRAGYLLGATSLAFGVAGTLLLPALLRRRVREGRVTTLPTIAMVTTSVGIAAAVLGALTATLPLALLGFGVVMFCAMGVGTLPTLVIQLYAPAHLRGRISAALFFTLYLLTIGVTPVIIPLIAHGMFAAENPLGRAIATVAATCGALAIAFFGFARRPLLRAEAARGDPAA